MTRLNRFSPVVLRAVLASTILLAGTSLYGESTDPSCAALDLQGLKAAFIDELNAMRADGVATNVNDVQSALREERSCRVALRRPKRRARSGADLYRQCRASVVMVGKLFNCGKCDKWHASIASGFVIRKDGVIVTNYHVVDDEKAAAICIRTYSGDMLPVIEVLASSKALDIAVLKVDAEDLAPLPVAEGADIGDPIYCISNPVGHFFTMTDGILAGDFVRRGGGRQIAVTCDYAKGSSGAPILDATGAVVGIVRVTSPVYYEKKDGINIKIQMVWKFCIPSSDLIDLVSQPKS